MWPLSPVVSDVALPLIQSKRTSREIIAKITAYVVAGSDNQEKAVLSMAQICKTWRETLIDNPRIWARVGLTASFDALQETLLRAKRVPLTITGSITPKPLEESTIEALNQELATFEEYLEVLERKLELSGEQLRVLGKLRMREWRIFEEEDRLCRQADLERDQSFHKLALIRRHLHHTQSLHLTISSTILAKIGRTDTPKAMMLEDLQIRQVDCDGSVDLSRLASPVLRRLKVSGFRSFDDFGMLACSMLRELDISNVHAASTTGAIIELLSRTPLLETLKLSVSLRQTQESNSLIKVIALPVLRRLTLLVSNVGEADILTFVRAPALELAYIHVCWSAKVSKVIEVVGRAIDTLSPKTFRGCTVRGSGIEMTEFMLTSETAAVKAPSPGEGIHLVMEGYYWKDEDVVVDLFRHQFQPTLSDIRCLSIQNGRARTEEAVETWKAFFLAMPAIKQMGMCAGRRSSLGCYRSSLRRSGSGSPPLVVAKTRAISSAALRSHL
ncbi:hypothetical protein OE88DRAFT_1662541, partial [Heliocybe sulcata]